MKLIIFVLTLIGYCFNINSGCCCKKKNTSKGSGGLNPNPKKKSKGPGGLDPNPKKSKGSDINKTTNKCVGPNNIEDENEKIHEIKIFNDKVEIVSDKSINLEKTSEDEKKKFVNENFVDLTKSYKIRGMYVCDETNVIVDDEVRATPYFVAIITLVDDDRYVVFVNGNDGNFSGLFSGIALSNITILSSEKVHTMSKMFKDCNKLQMIYIISLKTDEVKDMSEMFCNCNSLKSLDLRSFDTEDVTDMEAMFYGCSSLKSLDLSSFNTRNVNNMVAMFYGCKLLEKLVLGGSFVTGSVYNMVSMFEECGIKNLDLSRFYFDNCDEQALGNFVYKSNISKIIFDEEPTNEYLIKELKSCNFKANDDGRTWTVEAAA